MKQVFFCCSLLLLTACGSQISSFDDCVEAGYPVMESYPEQCSDGSQTFTRDIGNAPEVHDRIRVTSPQPGETVSFPLTVEGEATGGWYFEATFPVLLTDKNGTVLHSTYATADGDWMTPEFVPFSLTIDAKPVSDAGNLILRYSNASGEPERDAELRIPLRFQ